MTLSRRLLAVVAVAAAGLLLIAGPASAHNGLRGADPAQGATLTAAPTQVVLEFAERLDPAFTTIAVIDASGASVVAGQAQVSGPNATVAVRTPLPEGTYTVSYRVVSVDGHPVQGSYEFTVLAASPTSSPSAVPANSPDETASEDPTATAAGDADGSGGSGLFLPLAATSAGVLVLVGLVLLYRRRHAGTP